ncbi:hypothetical protein [Flagellimonas pelagia]|uniref:Uncharacterized protein n=1 Tax=Flagellimonas pelagia TaxID=2306998 RepID=A0A3A1NF45_9FLAO|nr:hypothetical protein [Allomuricauda maritima]RIV42080.1 hypothetical protein D2V05_18460 [Allomuricauda maritima]TXJ90966.1 hypothetical protein FQ017_18300 [Allomuricauda maritima]
MSNPKFWEKRTSQIIVTFVFLFILEFILAFFAMFFSMGDEALSSSQNRTNSIIGFLIGMPTSFFYKGFPFSVNNLQFEDFVVNGLFPLNVLIQTVILFAVLPKLKKIIAKEN